MMNFPSCTALHQKGWVCVLGDGGRGVYFDWGGRATQLSLGCLLAVPELLGPKTCDSLTVMVPPQLTVSQWSALKPSLCLCPCWRLKCAFVSAVEKNDMNRAVILCGPCQERGCAPVTWTAEFMCTLLNSGVTCHVFLDCDVTSVVSSVWNLT